MNIETYRIPIEVAHEILAAFGITRPTRAYERWVKDDGFDLKDFDEVLFESPFVYPIDWRAWLSEELETIRDSLARLNVNLGIELDENGEAGHVACDGRRAAVVYRPNEGSDLDDVIRAIQSVLPDHLELRAAPTNQDNDTAIYALRPKTTWGDLEKLHREVIEHFFVPLRARG